ncbi:DUF2958 domain-containing protein (plasmid) [Methylocapsa polymorpha]|uniref:DUF2958 domain-containing protein n=1 Tax=Methylocapsa polymorpha TaxID=3080828 RepID=A0ABZ0HYQ3_9HYPH|nr:DUF2958 domain-containing protein [Methylocapsa sp. RX1]WOJ91709.1 DUF2958 domain-containing protein [Methylocapsa sp. RX1]
MDLIPEDVRARLLANGAPSQREKDHFPVVKLFTPDAHATWLLTELDSDADLAFGLCDLGCPELGYVSLTEIASIRGRLGLPVERDVIFKARFPISVYAEAARQVGHITDADYLLARIARDSGLSLPREA